MADDAVDDFTDFVHANGLRLHRTAVLLAGDPHLAEDLLQTTYARLFASWRRVSRAGNPVGHARATLTDLFLSRRRVRSNNEPPTDLEAALGPLSPTDRAILVLRYWEDRTVAETASELGLTELAVRSRATMSLDQDEQLFVDALHRSTFPPPDLSAIALRATRSGTRLRHRHQARAAVATLAVVGVGLGGAAAVLSAGGHDPGRTATPIAGTSSPSVATEAPPAPTPAAPSSQALDTSSAYAVLDAPGWSAPVDNVISDDKLYYVQDGTDAGVSLIWRQSPGNGSQYTAEQQQTELDLRYGGDTVVAVTTIDGDVGHVFGDHGMFTVVGPVKHGRFLTLDCSNLTLEQITELATHVHRQARVAA